MATATKKATAPSMSDEAVKATTGKTWPEWFAIIDSAGGANMNHQEIAKYLRTKEGLSPWWQQMVTVNYELARGRREKHQKMSGYEINVSRTIKAPLARLFRSVANEKARFTWLPEEGLTIRNTTPNKTIRLNWTDGKSTLEFSFYAKSADKTQIVVTHRKLSNAQASAKMKSYWGKALDALRASIEE